MSSLFRPDLFRVAGLAVMIFARGLVAAPAPAAPSPAPTVQQRIDTLLKRRLQPEPLPINPPNPFQMTAGMMRHSTSDEPAPPPAAETALAPIKAPPVAGSLDILRGVAGKLKIGGIIVLKEQLHVVINGVPRKAGDTLSVEWENGAVQLAIARLQPGQIALRYADAEFTLKF